MTEHRYTPVRTDDGTLSLRDGELDEAMHSRTGAYEEALRKHVLPAAILELDRSPLRVLDVGFGMGYNLLALLRERVIRTPHRFVDIITLERDAGIFPYLSAIRFGDERDDLYASIRALGTSGSASGPGYCITLLIGDARETAKTLAENSFDAVFHDPFSPAKNPELWTVEFFSLVRRSMRSDSILTTYSSASQVRGALLEAGFRIGPGPSVGGKREGTLATISGSIPELTAQPLDELRVDPKSTPYRDHDLRGTREAIRERRREEMQMRRAARRDRPVP